MTQPKDSESVTQEAIKVAYDAMNQAWAAIVQAQDVMQREGIPSAVVELLDAPRLAVSNTSAFPPVVELVAWGERGFWTPEEG